MCDIAINTSTATSSYRRNDVQMSSHFLPCDIAAPVQRAVPMIAVTACAPLSNNPLPRKNKVSPAEPLRRGLRLTFRLRRRNELRKTVHLRSIAFELRGRVVVNGLESGNLGMVLECKSAIKGGSVLLQILGQLLVLGNVHLVELRLAWHLRAL